MTTCRRRRVARGVPEAGIRSCDRISSLSRLVKKYRKIYETRYQDIRNKTLANEVADDTELATLYAKTNIRDLDGFS
jgi:hypothetical protein